MPPSPDPVALQDGSLVPAIAYGSGTAWYKATGPDGISPELVEATKTAIKVGFSHLDAAELYGNELSTGAAIVACGLPREKLFVTTKVIDGVSCIEKTLRDQLRKLKVDYVDLYLIHSPCFAKDPQKPSLQQAWKSMEEVKAKGLAKSIGVSNYRISDLEETLKTAKVKPTVNQIEFHPYVWKEAEPLVKYMKEQGIALAAYGAQVPVVKHPGGKLDPILDSIASKHGITPGQVLLKWARAHGAIVVTTSSKESRMRSSLEAISNHQNDLTTEEVEEIGQVGIQNGIQRVFMKHMSE